MLKRRLRNHPLTELDDAEDRLDRLAAWVATDLRKLEIWGFMLIVSLLLSWLVSYLYITNRDARRDYVDTQLRNLACLALHYLPPDSPFYQDLHASYPKCPTYHPAKGVKRSPSPQPSKSSKVPRAQGAPSPTPSASLAPSPGGSSSATPTGSRTTSKAGHPKAGSTTTVRRTSTATRTATVTAKPGPIVSITVPVPVPSCIVGLGGIISVRPLVC